MLRRLKVPFDSHPDLPTYPTETKDDFPSTQRPPRDARIPLIVVDPTDIDTRSEAVVHVREMYAHAAEGQAFALAVRRGDASDPGSGLFMPAPPVVWRGNLARFAHLIARLLRRGEDVPAPAAAASTANTSSADVLTNPVAAAASDAARLRPEYPPHAGDPVIHNRVLVDFGAATASDEHAITVREKPLICSPNEVVLGGAASARLEIKLDEIRFDDHPLFCKEDWLAAGLQSLFETYCRRLRVSAAVSV